MLVGVVTDGAVAMIDPKNGKVFLLYKHMHGLVSYSEWSETRRCSIAIAFQFCFRICHQESPRK
jgi:hypothetical protein